MDRWMVKKLLNCKSKTINWVTKENKLKSIQKRKGTVLEGKSGSSFYIKTPHILGSSKFYLETYFHEILLDKADI